MGLSVIVQDASTGNPITDAQFALDANYPIPGLAMNEGYGQYFLPSIGQNENFCVSDAAGQYYTVCVNSGNNYLMNIYLKKPQPTTGWF